MNDNYPIPLNSLRYFFWAAKLSSFKLAAKKLNVSEAAVSQQIRNLESSFSVQLFVRSHQKIELTSKGKQLFPFIKSAFLSIHDGIETIAKDPEPNRLYLTTMPSIASHWLIRRLSGFNQLHPEISISIDTSIEIHDFESGKQDIAIRFGQGIYPGLKSELLLKDPTVLVCHPKLISGPFITRDDILRLPLIIGTSEGVQLAMQGFRDFYQFSHAQLSETLRLKDGSLGAEAARNGQGISLQRLSLVVDMINSSELAYADEFAFKLFNFYAVAPEHHFHKPKVEKFLAWLKTEMTKTAKEIAPYVAKIKN